MAGNTEPGSTGRNWANLSCDPLLKIFMMLNVMDLLSASWVCSSWRQVSRDSSLWNTLDVSELNGAFSTFQEPNTSSEEDSIARFMRTLNRAFNLSGGTISRLILHVYTSNEHFIWVAKRTPNLKQLILPSWHMFTVKAFDQAVQNWKGLESLIVPCHCFRGEFIKSIGTHAKNFFELKVMRGFDIDFALYVACYTPRLKVLSLQATTVDIEGLEYILDNMKDLEVVNICHSLLMVDPDRPDYYLEHKVDESMLRKASHLKEFLYCKTDSCLMCKSMVAPYGLWCVSYSSRAWREDEIRRLAC